MYLFLLKFTLSCYAGSSLRQRLLVNTTLGSFKRLCQVIGLYCLGLCKHNLWCLHKNKIDQWYISQSLLSLSDAWLYLYVCVSVHRETDYKELVHATVKADKFKIHRVGCLIDRPREEPVFHSVAQSPRPSASVFLLEGQFFCSSQAFNCEV